MNTYPDLLRVLFILTAADSSSPPKTCRSTARRDGLRRSPNHPGLAAAHVAGEEQVGARGLLIDWIGGDVAGLVEIDAEHLLRVPLRHFGQHVSREAPGPPTGLARRARLSGHCQSRCAAA